MILYRDARLSSAADSYLRLPEVIFTPLTQRHRPEDGTCRAAGLVNHLP